MKKGIFLKMILTNIIGFLIFNGCASETGGLTERESGALVGGGLGAGLGAIVGSQTGNAGAGTAIGAGAGALTGALVGESQRRQKEATKKELREEILQQQAAQPAVTVQPENVETHKKFNPRTGQTFPDTYVYDPSTGETLAVIQG